MKSEAIFQAKPVLDDEGEEVRHGGGPQPTQGVVVKAGVQRDDVVLGNKIRKLIQSQ